MYKYLEYRDGKSHKFWEIRVENNAYTVRYGRIGSEGRKLQKQFPSHKKALEAANKQVKNKLQKNYVEIAGAKTKMDLERFWQLIARSRRQSKADVDEQLELLVSDLSGLSAQEIAGFHNIFRALHGIALGRHYLWAAAYIVRGGGCSDDSFDYFCNWLVLQGKEVFDEVLRDPESDILIKAAHKDELGCECSILLAQMYNEKTGKNPDQCSDWMAGYDLAEAGYQPPQAKAQYTDLDEHWEDEELLETFRKLCKHFPEAVPYDETINPYTPLEELKKLAQDEDEWVRREAELELERRHKIKRSR